MSEHVLTDTTFESFDLHPLLREGLADCGFTRCTPIQALTLPLALAGRDVAGQAQTGTGKTCAFLVALMNRLLTKSATAERKDTDPRALIIAPTRELAIQIDKDARALGANTGLKTALIYGGVDYDKQRQMLKDGCDIIVATPGRLLDYYKQNVFGLNGVELMVIDEADRMFDLGFIKDVRFIFRRLPAREERQVLLYSATLSHRVLELAYEHMHEAEKLVVETDNITADRVRQVVYFPAKEEKIPLLLNLLQQMQPTRSLIFINTKVVVERVTERLKRHGYRAAALSGDVPQLKRQKLLQRFKDGQLDMLVCTDVAARGLHIPEVSHVFNYDMPQDAEDYVHRVGRTARLGAEGDAVSFACDLYAMSLPDIESYIEMKIPVASVEPELLVMPKPHTADAQFVADAAADSEAFGDKVEPREGDAKKSGSKGASSRPRHAGGEGSRSRKPRQPQAAAAQTQVPADATDDKADAKPANHGPAQLQPDSHANGSADGAPRKRRRRGGRNRKRGHAKSDAGNDAASTSSPAAVMAASDDKSRADSPRTDKPRAPRRARSGTDAGQRNGAKQPSAQVPATRQKAAPATSPANAKPKKSGFLRRLFGGN